MKKLILLFIGVISMFTIEAQNISDALRYSEDEIKGTARFRALSGAFGALGGDMSAVSLNPAGSAIFNSSHASFTLSNSNIENDTRYFNGSNNSSDSDIDFAQGGAAFVFNKTGGNSTWNKLVLGFSYDKFQNFEDDWFASGTGTSSIGEYFLAQAQGLRLDEISAFPDESIADAYADIGNSFGFTHQQAFLGFESYILEPDADDDANTTYASNIANGNFNQEFAYAATGYNGKVAFNVAGQYGENLFLGLNLNSHFISYDRSTYYHEINANAGTYVNEVNLENYLSTIGNGFSFQLGGILKLNESLRAGLTYNSPTWLSLEEETSEFISTVRDESGTPTTQVVNPQIINIYPRYKLQTPSKITGSLAYVGEQGLISFDYSRKDYGATKFRPTSDTYYAFQNDLISDKLKAANAYRLGGEYKHKQFSFRGGYRFEESPYENETTIGDLTGYSLGLGYSFGNTKLDVTFDQAMRDSNYQFLDDSFKAMPNIDAVNTNLTFSLSFTL